MKNDRMTIEEEFITRFNNVYLSKIFNWNVGNFT